MTKPRRSQSSADRKRQRRQHRLQQRRASPQAQAQAQVRLDGPGAEQLPAELLPLLVISHLFIGAQEGASLRVCLPACVLLRNALARLDIPSEIRIVQATVITKSGREEVIGSLTPSWDGRFWSGHAVLYLPDQGRIVDPTLPQAKFLPKLDGRHIPLIARVLGVAAPAGVAPVPIADVFGPGAHAATVRGDVTILYEVAAAPYQMTWDTPRLARHVQDLDRKARTLADLTVEYLQRHPRLRDRVLTLPYPALQQRLLTAEPDSTGSR